MRNASMQGQWKAPPRELALPLTLQIAALPLTEAVAGLAAALPTASDFLAAPHWAAVAPHSFAASADVFLNPQTVDLCPFATAMALRQWRGGRPAPSRLRVAFMLRLR